jgi:hypothetical protein
MTAESFDKPIPRHHYSEQVKERLAWGNEDERDIGWEYSDRLEREPERHKRGVEAAGETKSPRRSPCWYEAYLSGFFGRGVEMLAVRVGSNLANGFPYEIFGYRFVSPAAYLENIVRN